MLFAFVTGDAGHYPSFIDGQTEGSDLFRCLLFRDILPLLPLILSCYESKSLPLVITKEFAIFYEITAFYAIVEYGRVRVCQFLTCAYTFQSSFGFLKLSSNEKHPLCRYKQDSHTELGSFYLIQPIVIDIPVSFASSEQLPWIS